jgi:phosphate transport system substrate-binding protein
MQNIWIPGYHQTASAVAVSYSAVGSGAGIGLWTAGSADFAASDALLKPTQESAAAFRCGASPTKIPATIGSVALIYNVPGVSSGLRLSPTALTGIFLGQIHTWNDTQIKKLNPSLKLPGAAIHVVYRSDSSGTTYILTHYLAAVSSDWSAKVSAGSTVAWPTGAGATKGAGMMGAVKGTSGAIGYIDLGEATKQGFSMVSVQNKSGQYVAPGVDAASAAADSFASSMPSDLQQVIVNSASSSAYPISGYSYIFLCSHQKGAAGRALVNFVRYVVTTGQGSVKAASYAPLPSSVQSKDLAALSAIKVS